MTDKKPEKGRPKKMLSGYRPVLHAREGLMLGIRNPLDGPIFKTLTEAEQWCVSVMNSHYDRMLGMSDARIYPFRGMVEETIAYKRPHT